MVGAIPGAWLVRILHDGCPCVAIESLAGPGA
jgi:hypothetical protein